MTQLVCETCIHFNVCQYKETFEAAQKAVNKTKVMVSGPEGKCYGDKNISEIDFIEEPKLKCKHYRTNTLAGVKGGLER